MVWIDFGTITPLDGEWQTIPVLFPSEFNWFRLSYPFFFDNGIDGNGWLRFHYPQENLYSESWIKFFRKNNESEFFFDSDRNYIPNSLRYVQVKKQLFQSYRGARRASLNWEVEVSVWDERINLRNSDLTNEVTVQEQITQFAQIVKTNLSEQLDQRDKSIESQVQTAIITLLTGGI
jgi:hypothetical protein